MRKERGIPTFAMNKIVNGGRQARWKSGDSSLASGEEEINSTLPKACAEPQTERQK